MAVTTLHTDTVPINMRKPRRPDVMNIVALHRQIVRPGIVVVEERINSVRGIPKFRIFESPIIVALAQSDGCIVLQCATVKSDVRGNRRRSLGVIVWVAAEYF